MEIVTKTEQVTNFEKMIKKYTFMFDNGTKVSIYVKEGRMSGMWLFEPDYINCEGFYYSNGHFWLDRPYLCGYHRIIDYVGVGKLPIELKMAFDAMGFDCSDVD